MIGNLPAVSRASRLILVAALALPVSPCVAAQEAPSPRAPDTLNLQLPAQAASTASGHAGKAPVPRHGASTAQASPASTQDVRRFRFADSAQPPPAPITAAERALRAHERQFDRQPDCPTPFGPVAAPSSEPRGNQRPNCRTWRKPANGR